MLVTGKQVANPSQQDNNQNIDSHNSKRKKTVQLFADRKQHTKVSLHHSGQSRVSLHHSVRSARVSVLVCGSAAHPSFPRRLMMSTAVAMKASCC